jgi:hypothetical protein
MARLLGMPLASAIILIVWIYALIDVIKVDESDVKHLPKILWLVIVLFLSFIGAILWFGAGRPPYRSWEPGAPIKDRRRPPQGRGYGPEDDPNWR